MPSEHRRVGIREVAAAAGVSLTTVSHALNDKGRLPEATRARVRAIAAELGYRPNVNARNLVVGRTGLLGVALARHDGPLPPATDFARLGQLTTAASATAVAAGYALVLAPPDGVIAPRGAISVDGAIIIDPIAEDPLVGQLREAGIPLVTAGGLDGGRGQIAAVTSDDAGATTALLDHLRGAGARRIALLTGASGMPAVGAIERTYGDWCEADGSEACVVTPVPSFTERAGYTAAGELFASAQPPDAIFATDERLAYGAQIAAEARGLSIPADLLLATVATVPAAPDADRSHLTALELDVEEVGRVAADLLVAMLDGRPARHVVVPYRLVVRTSTGRAG